MHAVDELHRQRVLEQVAPARLRCRRGRSGIERAVHQRPGVVAHAGVEPGDEGAGHDLQEDQHQQDHDRPHGGRRRGRRRVPARAERGTQISAMNSSDAAKRWAARRYCETEVSSAEAGRHHPPAQRALEAAEDEQAGQRRGELQEKRRWTRKTRNGTAKSSRGGGRGAVQPFPPEDELEVVEAHPAVVELVYCGICL